MEKLEGVTGAFVNDGITLLVDHDRPLDEAAVKSALDPHKIKITKVDKAAELPF